MQNIHHSFRSEEQIARFYAKVAIRSLYHELALYPKPGLVSFIDSGAHMDMDGQLFFRSLLGLRHYFFQVSLSSIQGKENRQLVRLGREAERKMFQMTQGINTHKGAIFSLGILCSTIAKLTSQKSKFSIIDLQQSIKSDWSLFLEEHQREENSNGQMAEKKYHLSGALNMAIGGYQPVFKVFEDLSYLGVTDQKFYGLLAFKSLLLQIDDTNILHRVGIDGLRFARTRVTECIDIQNRQRSIKRATKLHEIFSKKNISPGGVADMLGMIFFLKQIFQKEHL